MTVEGELDRATSEMLRDYAVALGSRGCRRVLVDLRKTTFIEPSGLSALVAAMEDITELGGELVLRAPPPNVYAQGRLRRLGELLAIVDEAINEAEAISRLSRLFSPEDFDGREPHHQAGITGLRVTGG